LDLALTDEPHEAVHGIFYSKEL